MRRRLVVLLTAAVMLAGLFGTFPAAAAESSEEIMAETPVAQFPAEEVEPGESDAAGNDIFPALEFEEWEPVENTEHPGGLAPNPFWRSYIGPVAPADISLQSELPAKYDLRTLGRSTVVKDQHSWGTCWAFGCLSALESNILTQVGAGGSEAKTEPDYSEHHLAWFGYHPQTAESLADSEVGQGQLGEGRAADSDGLHYGGNIDITTSVLGAWQGAASEASIPYQNTDGGTGTDGDWSVPESKRNESVVHLTDVDFLPSPASFSAYKSNGLPAANATYSYDETAVEHIKRAIMEHGAVAVAYYADQSRPGGSKDGTYFNYTNNCQFVNVSNESTAVNHEVCIVGWDDNYPRTNFNAGIQPEGDGAWIAKNSWGAGWCEDGYFYLSYYDRTISDVSSLQGETDFSYDHNYQYDYLNLGSYRNIEYTSAKMGVANVFTANGSETLKAVSLVTNAAGSDVTIEVYRLKADAVGPYDGVLASVCSETLLYAGYHTLDMDTPVYLSKDDRFSVVALIERPDGRYYQPLEVGCETEGYIAVVNPGETYRVYPDNHTFKDVSEETKGKYTVGNAMVKAFTVETDPNLPSVTVQPIDQTTRVGETVAFSITAVGDGLSYQWQVSTDQGATWADVPGATSESYTTPALTYAMEGNHYRCRVSNSYGTIFSDGAAITRVFPASTTEIANLAELEAFRDNVNAGIDYTGVTVRLTADIDMSENYGSGKADWTPIGNSYYCAFPATAIFDGDGHTISGLYINHELSGSYYYRDGLFGHNKGTIQNLVVSGSVTGKNYVGGVCGENYGTMTDCCNTGIVSGSNNYVGGVCGYNDGGSLTNCCSTGEVSGKNDDVGGVCGYNAGGSMTDCYNTGDVSAYSYSNRVGGVCGYNDGGSIINCYNTGDISGEYNSVGGVCGQNYGTMADCCNTGIVSGRGDVGGVCGYNYNGSMTNCYNNGDVSGTDYYVGGVCGYNYGSSMTNCYNNGDVSGEGDDLGGVCGYNKGGSIINCYNTGIVSGDIYYTTRAGGVCGVNTGSMTNCYNTGDVSGIFSLGGICARNDGGAISDCYNTGNVSGSPSVGGDSGVGGLCGKNTSGTISNCYSTGRVSGGSEGVGSFCGGSETTVPETITNCYYLSSDPSDKGLQYADDVAGQVEAKTAEQFASGEVAYLLQSAKGGVSADQVWGQSVKGVSLDASPVLSSDPDNTVYKVNFCIAGGGSNKIHAVKYANPAGVSGLPDPPVSGTTKLSRWFMTADVDGDEFTEDTPISSDNTNVYAIGETMYGENDGEKTVTLTYGANTEPTKVDLSQYVVMGDNSDTQGQFKFTITDGGIDSVQITDQEVLEIAADIPANEAGYPVKIRAFKMSSDPVLMTASLGTESFEFTVTVVVHKGAGSGSVSLEGWTYGEPPQTPAAVSETNGVENVTYFYKAKGAGDDTYSATVPTAAGEYTLLAKFAATDNYREVQSTADFTIAQAASGIDSAPQAQKLVYTGAAQELVTAGTASGGELQYSLDGVNYSAAIPTATEVGSYTVYYILSGDANHVGSTGGTVVVQIDKAEPPYTVPQGLYAGWGSTLADVALPNGWRWADETQVISEAGINTFDAIYTPEDTNHYQTVTVSLSVAVDVKIYNVTLETNGGTVKSGDVKSYIAGMATALPTDVVKSGYRFAGWYDNADLTGDPVVEIPKDAVGDKAFYAKWKKRSSGSSHSKPVTEPEPDPEPQPKELHFKDVEERDWFYGAVYKVVDAGLMQGVSDTEFVPGTELTRGMVVTILHRLENEPETDFVSTFEDCAEGMYFAEPVAWANEHKIVKGYSATHFAPDDSMTREQMAAIIYRYAEFRGLDLGTDGTDKALPYVDSGSISDYALEPVRWVTERGLMQGNEAKCFSPQARITRAETAMIFQRILDQVD